MTYRPHLGLWDKALTYLSWAGAGAVFLTVGWIALEPLDPLGVVSLRSGGGAMAVLFQVCAIGAVVSGLVTVVAGRKLSDVGTFAVALGMGLVALRGNTMEYVLLDWVERDAGSIGLLAPVLAMESLGWLVAIVVAVIVSGLVRGWVFGSVGCRGGDGGAMFPIPAAWDVPGLSRYFGAGEVERTALLDGVKHTVVAAAATIVLYRVLGGGLHDRRIDHGQVCFVLAASVWLGGSIAYHVSPVRSALWSILAVGIVAVAAYLIAAVTSGGGDSLPPNIPASHYLRTLPVQYVAVGSASAVLTFWWQWAPERLAERD
jgi:hypothetical protein